MKIQSINPYTEQVIGEFELLTKAEIDRKIEKAGEAFKAWRNVPVAKDRFAN